MENNPIKIQVTDQSVTARAKRGQRSGGPWLLICCFALILLLVGAFLLWKWESNTPRAVVASPKSPANLPQASDVPLSEPTTSEASEPLADDGESLWASPTDGQPIDCSHLLPGTQLVVHVRVAELLAHDEGDKVMAGLGPWGQQIVDSIREITKVELVNVDSLLLGIRQSRSGSLDFALRMHLHDTVTQEEIGRDCFLPKSEDRKLVWCSASARAELQKNDGEPPLFPRELARVLTRTDSQRIATLVFSGKFLQISGEKFLHGSGETLRTAIVDFLGEEATATALSAHWDDNFFLELCSTVTLNERPHRFAALLEERVTKSSDRVEDSLLSRSLHPHGRKVLARFPAMLRKLGNYTRAGEDDKLSLLRTYLPVNAGHNLLMASELLLNSDRMSQNTTADAVNAKPAEQPQTLSQRLQQTTSLVFPKETLQKALEILSEDLGVPIQIAGNDLQLEGITKNQSLAIDLRDRPAGEILLAVLLRANPDRTASGPTDEKQKLVYVVRESSASQPGAIVVTTRSAAKRRGEKLPAVFEPGTR